jgi:hypothetical protein
MESYCLADIRELVLVEAPSFRLEYPVYLMGPYTLEDLQYGLDSEDVPLHYDDPLVDYAQETNMENILKRLRDFVREEYGFRAFTARDVPIPTYDDLEDYDDPPTHGMSPATQSKLFTAVSNAAIFVFPIAGLTDGVSSELGGIAEFLGLSVETPGDAAKPSERCLVLQHARFGSATVDEHWYDCDMTYDEYRYTADIEPALKNFLESVYDADISSGEDEFPVHELPADWEFTAHRLDELPGRG